MKKLLLLSIILLYSTNLVSQVDDNQLNGFFKEIDKYLYEPAKTRQRSNSLFSELKAVAETSNSTAYYYLGFYYKDGIGTKSNLKKSRRAFKQAYDLGYNEAAYCIGYYHLKGMGNVPQNYNKAFSWFKKGKNPMSKHWLAKMHLFGYGTERNLEKAIEILERNDLHNSRVLLSQLDSISAKDLESSQSFQHILDLFKDAGTIDIEDTMEMVDFDSLFGDWTGEFWEFDWSGNRILRSLKANIKFKSVNDSGSSIRTTIDLADSVTQSTAYLDKNVGELLFSDLSLPIPKRFTDYLNFTHLITEVSNLKLYHLEYEGDKYLAIKMEGFLPLWNEKSKPGLFILKQLPFVSEEAQSSFDSQSNDYLRVYPNPFNEQFLVNFDLDKSSSVKLILQNHYNTSSYLKVLFEGTRDRGNHTLESPSLPLDAGTYILKLQVDGHTHSKLLIKN